jgi:hypothetical protein
MHRLFATGLNYWSPTAGNAAHSVAARSLLHVATLCPLQQLGAKHGCMQVARAFAINQYMTFREKNHSTGFFFMI